MKPTNAFRIGLLDVAALRSAAANLRRTHTEEVPPSSDAATGKARWRRLIPELFHSARSAAREGVRFFALRRAGLLGSALAVLVCLGLASRAVAFPAYPLVKSPNGRYLVDQAGAPFLMVGDSPHSLIVTLSEADEAVYLADRSAHGFNSLWVETLCTTYTGGPVNASTIDGILPFTSTIPGTNNYDLTTPNEAYFAHVDRVVNMAAQQGLLVMLDPIETGGWLATMRNNGVSRCFAYGQYLGNRYKSFTNILWMSGNDFQTWTTASDDALVLGVVQGIRSLDTNHLHTVELNYPESSSLDDPNWASVIGLNGAYTYAPTYAEVLHAYGQSSTTPVSMIEANYEFEDDWNNLGPLTPKILRLQEYWTLLSGASGQLYGNHYTWTFISGWQANMDTVGAAQLGYVTALFGSREWYNLVPDTSHLVVTEGYGTYTTTGTVLDSDYATAASTPDGKLAIVYMPTIRTIRVNLSGFSSTVSAQWYDPASGTYAQASGSPFANSGTHDFTPFGNNSAGDVDWVLVLDAIQIASPLQILTSSLPQGTAGTGYSSQLAATGGAQPYSWSLATGSLPLPPGLTLSAAGLLSGTPSTNGAFNLIVQVKDSTNALATEGLTLSIAAAVASDTNAPTIPSGVTATAAGGGQINVSWAASTDNVGVTGYLVQRSQGTGSTAFAQVGTPAGTTFSDTGLSAGTVYNYRVSATDAAGNESAYSGVASATTLAAPPPAGPVAAYAFSEGAGTTTADASGNGITGTINGATWTTGGRYGDALFFNGASSYVNLGNPAPLQLTGSMTVEAWVIATGTPADDGQIVAKSNGFGWQFKTSPDTGVRTFAVGVSPNSTSLVQRYSKTVLSLNTWYHVAGVYNAAAQTLDIYVNGVLDDGVLSGTVPGAQFNSSLSALIGRRSDGFYFAGTIDEVRIYSQALSAAAIQTDMATPIGGSSATDTTPPSAPAGLNAAAVSSSQINLSWAASTDNVAVTDYLVERSLRGGSYVQIATTTATTFNNTGLSRRTTYSYRVRASDAAGNLSGYSNVASATTTR